MRNAIVIYPVRGKGYAFAISFPKVLVESFKELFHHQDDRAWRDPLWCFKRSSLSNVRAWATQQVQHHLLTLYDLAELNKAKREALLAEIWRQEDEEHIAAMGEVLPLLPAKALRLASWRPTHMVLDLQIYLERPLFDQLKQAALPPGKVPSQTAYIPQQKHSDSRFYIAPDPRILRVLMHMRVQNFSALALERTELFTNGTMHFHDQEKRLWFGVPYDAVIGSQFNFMAPADHSISLPYTVTMGEKENIYLVAPAEAYLMSYCRGIAPAIVGSMSPQPPSEALVELFRHYHLETWLQAHVSELFAAPPEVLIPRPGVSHSTLWRDPHSWTHAADALLHYLRISDHDALLLLLGWDEERFHAIQGHVQQLKEQRAEAYYNSCEEHAVDLMQERLTQFQRADIQELAARYGISLPLRTKEKMIQACVNPQMAADLIGVTEERQRRQGLPGNFTNNGIPWGKRASGELYDHLRRGYLSDRTWTLSCLKKDASSIWYALWEGWPPRAQIASHQWSPYTFIEQRNMDLQSCRWFAYPHSEMPASEEHEDG